MIRFLSIDVQQGETVTGSIVASQPATVKAFILSDAALTKWNNATTPYCDPADNDIEIAWSSSATELTDISIKWTPPQDGKYWVCPEVEATGADLITIKLTSPSVQIYTSVLFSTSVATSMFATTQTLASMQVQAVSPPESTGGSGDVMIPIAIAIVVVALIGIAGFTMLRRKKQPKG